MWTPVSDYGEMPKNLPNEFLNSEFNMDIMGEEDLLQRVNAFIKHSKKGYKKPFEKEVTRTLLKYYQRELRYSFDSF